MAKMLDEMNRLSIAAVILIVVVLSDLTIALPVPDDSIVSSTSMEYIFLKNLELDYEVLLR